MGWHSFEAFVWFKNHPRVGPFTCHFGLLFCFFGFGALVFVCFCAFLVCLLLLLFFWFFFGFCFLAVGLQKASAG